MAGIILAAAGIAVILAATAGFIIIYRILDKKKRKIRNDIARIKG